MRKSYAWLLVFAAAALGGRQARAQADFGPGYLVRAAGDTVRGQLDYRTARQSNLSCRFRPDAHAAPTTYGPAELRGYGLPGATYRALAVPTPAGTSLLRFGQVLRDGAAQLYFLRDEAGDHYYVQSSRLPLSELKHEFRTLETEGRTFQEEQNGFRQLLAQALADCPAAQAMLPRLPYAERSFERAVAAYNACQAGPGAPSLPGVAGGAGVRLGVGLLGGVQHSQIDFTDPYASFTSSSAQYRTTVTGPVVGAELWLRAARLSRKVSFHLQVLYQPQHFSYTYSPVQFLGGAPGPPVTADFRQDFLRLPLLVRYTVPLGFLRLLAEAGASGAYKLQNTGTYSYFTASGTPLAVSLNDKLARGQAEFAVVGGLGVGVALPGRRELLVHFRAEPVLSKGDNQLLIVSAPRLYGLLSLDLTKP